MVISALSWLAPRSYHSSLICATWGGKLSACSAWSHTSQGGTTLHHLCWGPAPRACFTALSRGSGTHATMLTRMREGVAAHLWFCHEAFMPYGHVGNTSPHPRTSLCTNPCTRTRLAEELACGVLNEGVSHHSTARGLRYSCLLTSFQSKIFLST